MHDQTSKEKTILFTSCMLLVVGLFSIDLYNPSLPAITKDLAVTQALTRGLVVTFLVGFSFSQLIYGPLSDQYGRKPIIIVSLILTILGNLLTASATNGTQLLVYRFLTGIGAGGCPVISRAILRDIFHEKKQLTKAFSIFAMSAQVSPSFAPIIGGFIEQYYSWQIDFIALSIITLASLCILLLTFKDPIKNKTSINIKNMLNNYKELLSNIRFCSYSVMSAFVFSYTIGYYTINPFIFQHEFGFTPLKNGIIYILYSAGLLVGSYATRKLIDRYDPETLLKNSIVLMFIFSFCMLVFISYIHNIYLVLLFTTLIALLCGVSAPILISLSILPFPKIAGSASALQGAIKMIGTAMALSFFLLFHIETGKELAWTFVAISIVLLLLHYFFAKEVDVFTVKKGN